MIRVFAETTITRLLKDASGRIAGAFGYFRDTGRFVLFEAPTVIMATGGIGRTYKVTSNSWEYSGDGHALALLAGADLMNMEFVQFHPTGMVWPPSVRGLLVTESVRGDGGVLRNSEGKRFMFDYVPDVFRAQYAETEEEADRWYTDPDHNRRPPELLPRDEVARSINSEIKAGRGSPHGGVFLDIASRRPAVVHPAAAAVHVPPVHGAGGRGHHQGADGDRADLPLRDGRRRGRPGHGGVLGARAVRGGRGVRRHARLQPARRQLAVRPAGVRQAGRRRRGGLPGVAGFVASRPYRQADLDAAVAEALAPLSRTEGENPYTVHAELQQMMNDLVGLIRRESEVKTALVDLEKFKERAARVAVPGERAYNPGWHYSLDLRNMLLVAECVAMAALERQESRGGHTREDYPAMSPEWRKVNLILTLDGDKIDMVHKPLPVMRPDLLDLFDKRELKKYMTKEELAGLHPAACAAALEEGH